MLLNINSVLHPIKPVSVRYSVMIQMTTFTHDLDKHCNLLEPTRIRMVDKAANHEINGRQKQREEQEELEFDDPLDTSDVERC